LTKNLQAVHNAMTNRLLLGDEHHKNALNKNVLVYFTGSCLGALEVLHEF